MRPFESASGTHSVQKSSLNLSPGARWVSPAAFVICVGLLASVILSSTSFGQQSPSGSGQFRKRSTTGGATSSAIDSKLKGFLEQQAGIDQTQQIEQTPQRATRTHVRSNDSSRASHQNTEPHSAGIQSARSATSVNDRPSHPSTNDHAISHDREERSSAIQQAAWEPESDAASGRSGSNDRSIAGPLQPETISELQPTPSAGAEQKPVEISVPLKSSADAGLFLDLRNDAKPRSPSAPIGERGAEVAIETSPVQVLSRAVAWIVIALCLFSLAALGVRRWQRQRGLLPTPGSRSRVIETLSLGPGRSVSLIEMAGHRALVAFDAGGIKQLVLTPPSFHDELTEADEPMIYERPAKTRTDLTVPASETQT